MKCLLKIDIFATISTEQGERHDAICLIKETTLPLYPFIGLNIRLEPSILTDDPRVEILSRLYPIVPPLGLVAARNIYCTEGTDEVTVKCDPLHFTSLEVFEAAKTIFTMDYGFRDLLSVEEIEDGDLEPQ